MPITMTMALAFDPTPTRPTATIIPTTATPITIHGQAPPPTQSVPTHGDTHAQWSMLVNDVDMNDDGYVIDWRWRGNCGRLLESPSERMIVVVVLVEKNEK